MAICLVNGLSWLNDELSCLSSTHRLPGEAPAPCYTEQAYASTENKQSKTASLTLLSSEGCFTSVVFLSIALWLGSSSLTVEKLIGS